MRKALENLPVFAAETLAARIAPWRSLMAGPGNDRIVVEWCIGQGPRVLVYPAADRKVGFNLLAAQAGASSDEQWADFLEFDYVPQVEAAVRAQGFRPQVICADQRPVQVMRQRRRALSAHGSH